ncbi:MAG: hypothetical protein R3E10_18705 [Gemmatimonadota bacterium]
MNEFDDVRDLLPEWLEGSLSDAARLRVEAALADDPDLRAEAELLGSLRAARPEPPEELVARVRAGLRQPSVSRASRGRWPTWQLSAAAGVVVAAGTALLWQQRTAPLPDLEPLPRSWMMDDAVVAGGLVLDGLSEDALETLVTELER